jgi:SAM-dependent methyltransferase
MLKLTVRRIEAASRLFGIDLRRGYRRASSLGRFAAQRREFFRQSAASTREFPSGKLYPCLGDDEGESGTASGHYFHQDLLVAQRVFQRAPRRHVDVGSRVDGFVAHVASFREIEVFDIRKLSTSARGIRFTQCDAMQPDALPEGYADSVSCLHALEHFGLGRFGDPIDYNGHLRGWQNLVRLLEPGGILYLSVPMGPQRVEFNGQRVFSFDYLVSLARTSNLTMAGFSYVDDTGELHADEQIRPLDASNNFGCKVGCGIFEFQKPAASS